MQRADKYADAYQPFSENRIQDAKVTTSGKRVAVIGAGPIGLEAALYAVRNGYDVDLYERGRVAENVRRWGHVRLFSPFGLNVSAWGRTALAESDQPNELPADDALLSGREFAERYLLPLSRLPALSAQIHEGVSVRRIARARAWKGDLVGKPQRGNDPFRLLVCDAKGERYVEADWVLDCSGTYPHHNWIGAGGQPAIDEISSLHDVDYELPDILGARRADFSGKKTLVIGGGYSAATSVVSLAELAESDRATSVVWVTRSDRDEPLVRIENDALVERDRLSVRANRLATSPSGPVAWKPGRLIERVATVTPVEAGGAYRVTLIDCQRAGDEELVVDRVIANVGFRPDRSLYEELQVHECYASSGPMKLAAALLGETSADCLSQASHGAETLRNPEPGFFILGAKSYGRDSRFLMKIGIEQIQDLFALMSEG